MTVTESQAVNILARYLLGELRIGGRPVGSAEARDALATLARSSHKRLMAGLTEAQVFDRWELPRACRACGCTDDRACDDGCHWVEPDLCSACEEVARG